MTVREAKQVCIQAAKDKKQWWQVPDATVTGVLIKIEEIKKGQKGDTQAIYLSEGETKLKVTLAGKNVGKFTAIQLDSTVEITGKPSWYESEKTGDTYYRLYVPDPEKKGSGWKGGSQRKSSEEIEAEQRSDAVRVIFEQGMHLIPPLGIGLESLTSEAIRGRLNLVLDAITPELIDKYRALCVVTGKTETKTENEPFKL